SGPTFANAETAIGGGMFLQAGPVAITNSGALGGPVTAARNSAASLRAEGGPVTITQIVDVNPGTAGQTFTVFGNQPVTFAGPVTMNNNSTIQISDSAPVAFTGTSNGGTALDLGNFTLTLNTISSNTT